MRKFKQRLRYNKVIAERVIALHKNYELETNVITNHEERQESIITIGMTIITAMSFVSFDKKSSILSMLVIVSILWLISYFSNHAFSIFTHGMYRKSIEKKINRLSKYKICEWEYVYTNYYQKNPFLYIMLFFASLIGVIESGISLLIIVDNLGYKFIYNFIPFVISGLLMIGILYIIIKILLKNVRKICDERNIKKGDLLLINKKNKEKENLTNASTL